MALFIIAVGNKMPDWVDIGFKDYAKRLPNEFEVHLKEVKPVIRKANQSPESAMETEKSRIESVIPKGAKVVALDEKGQTLTSVHLAKTLQKWHEESKDIAFVIGGADGLDPEFKKKAHHLIRLSDMTLPHGMVRVLLAEQLYRAYSIIKNHPYHRV